MTEPVVGVALDTWTAMQADVVHLRDALRAAVSALDWMDGYLMAGEGESRPFIVDALTGARTALQGGKST